MLLCIRSLRSKIISYLAPVQLFTQLPCQTPAHYDDDRHHHYDHRHHYYYDLIIIIIITIMMIIIIISIIIMVIVISKSSVSKSKLCYWESGFISSEAALFRELKQTRRRRKRERQLKM